jgi:APA family basic amino acid/polyamine antiporter
MQPDLAPPNMKDLPRRIGLREATSVVVGTMIGAGIFLVPSSIARELGSPVLILVVWLVTGAISFFGALAYAELGAMLPHSGGQYIYIRESYGALPAFVCGWTLFLVIQSGAIAAVSVGCGIYLSYLFPSVPGVVRWAPLVLIGVLTLVNYVGVKSGTVVQQVFTLLKLVGLGLLIGSAWLGRPQGPEVVAGGLTQQGPVPGAGVIGLAMLGCFLAYDGWHYISFIAGEVRDPGHNLPWALVLGVSVVVVTYVLANIAYLRILPFSELAATPHVAASAAERTLGPGGATLVTLTIVLSTIGAANGAILTSPRVYFAQACDGLFFCRMAQVNRRFETPGFAILVQGLWTALLSLSGSYEALFSYVLFASWIFHAMSVFGVVILRRRWPSHPRPYRVWGYPFAPLLFVAFSLWLVVNTLLERPGPSLLGTLIIASGVPAYLLWRRSARQLRSSTQTEK